MTLNDRVKKISMVLDTIEKELAKRIEDMKNQEANEANLSYIKKPQRNARKSAKYSNRN